MALEKVEKGNFVSILASDATFRQVVPEGTEGAVKRDYETSDGKTGSKTELVFNKLRGKITKIEMYEGDYGKLVQATVTDESGDIILSINTAQPYGEDFMKKLPNIKLDQEVVISPYSFDDEKGKSRKGLSITQGDTKVQNFFYDADKKENINGFPEPEGDTKKYDTDDWKIYFTKVRKFLVKYTEDNFVKGTAKASDDLSDFDGVTK